MSDERSGFTRAIPWTSNESCQAAESTDKPERGVPVRAPRKTKQRRLVEAPLPEKGKPGWFYFEMEIIPIMQSRCTAP